MAIRIVSCTQRPEKDRLNPVLEAYYALIVERMRAMGFDIPASAPETALAEFWDRAEDYLPPTGSLVLAMTDEVRVVGCGMLKRLDHDTGELKRLFVLPEARGTGTGRRLVTARIDAARKMGLRRLVVDTLTPNVEMRALYPKLGFTEIPGPIDTTSYREQPMLRPHMHFFTMNLT